MIYIEFVDTFKGTAAANKAFAFLYGHIDECLRSGTVRLPVMHELARQGQVSVGTMSKAVAFLSRKGILAVSHKRGIAIQGSKDRQLASLDQSNYADKGHGQSSRQRVTLRLEADIAKGLYPSATRLPTFKELSLVYRTSGRTLRAAMLMLVKRGTLIQDGRGFITSGAPRLKKRSTISLIMRGHDNGEMLFTTARVQEQLSALERECSKANVNLKIIICNFYGVPFTSSGEQVGDLLSAVRADNLLGCIVWSLTFTRVRFYSIIHDLASLGKPLAVLDESGGADIQSGIRTQSPVGVFGMSFTQNTGVAVGRHLCSLGHRRIAYFSPYAKEIWSSNRLKGLKYAFSSAGVDDGVGEYVSSLPENWLSLDPSLINQSIVQYLPLDAAQIFISDKKQLINDMLLTTAVRDQLTLQSIRSSIYPMFEMALADKSITAWVASNDLVGVECLSFLRSKGYSIPREISVVSFDDSSLASLHRLCSYNFNCPAVMRSMVEYLLDRRVQWKCRSSGRPIEIEGFVTVRGSAGEAESSLIRS